MNTADTNTNTRRTSGRTAAIWAAVIVIAAGVGFIGLLQPAGSQAGGGGQVQGDTNERIVAGPAFEKALGGNVTRADLNFDGRDDYVIKAYRENMNAHSNNHFYFFIYGGDQLYTVDYMPDADSGKEWGRDSELGTSQGAECVLTDFRIMMNIQDKQSYLIEAVRDYGETYVDTMPVTFNYYKLTDFSKEQMEVGLNRYGWEQIKSVRSERPYCDVGSAFTEEMRLSDELIHTAVNWQP